MSRILSFVVRNNRCLPTHYSHTFRCALGTFSSALHVALWRPGPVNEIFEEPLVATGPTSPEEDIALSRAIAIYKTQTTPDNFRGFDAFLAHFPKSRWHAALLANLGLAYYHYGYFSKAIES